MGFSPRAFLPTEPGGLSGSSQGVPRLWRRFMAARVFVATVLLLLIVFLHMTAPLPGALLLCSAYLVLTLWVLVWGKPERPASRFDPQWLVTIGVDVIVFATLLYLQIGAVNFTPLFVLPVLLAAVLGPLLLALGTAATVTVALLIEAWQTSILSNSEATTRFLQAALTGTGLFVVAYLANHLAWRLARQERLARNSAMAARAQTQVNQVVMDTLSDGVLVVDTNGIVRIANPAARAMLGPRARIAGEYEATPDFAGSILPANESLLPNSPFVLASQAAWQPLVSLASNTLALRRPHNAEVAITDTNGATRRLYVRTQLAAASYSGEHDADTLCVLFLEDLREMEAKLRTEKLAAMGRMSAAVAHEIRNPLAAISQANALLAEDLVQPAQLKLSQMVQHNAKRLARIVDDVLDVSRVTPLAVSDQRIPHAERSILAICKDWSLQHGCGERLRLPHVDTQSAVVFEGDHLRRVLVNLLDNALRYASQQPAAIEVFIQTLEPHAQDDDARPGSTLRLAVWSDAPPLDQGVQQHLFEPFFSSESRSSGLGLYICRELCARHGAVIGYQRSERVVAVQERGSMAQSGNEFFVVMQVTGDSFSDSAIMSLF
jgi:two-component system, NtrC family, sensor histidine kinase PilS